MRRAWTLATLALACTPDRASYQTPDPVPRWRDALAALDLEAAWLADARIEFAPDAEPGVMPDGSLLLPDAWRLTPNAPDVLARLAHLGRHRSLGLAAPTSRDACATWELHMLASELDGLSIELHVRHALGRPMPSDAAAAHIAQRVADYHDRCDRQSP